MGEHKPAKGTRTFTLVLIGCFEECVAILHTRDERCDELKQGACVGECSLSWTSLAQDNCDVMLVNRRCDETSLGNVYMCPQERSQSRCVLERHYATSKIARANAEYCLYHCPAEGAEFGVMKVEWLSRSRMVSCLQSDACVPHAMPLRLNGVHSTYRVRPSYGLEVLHSVPALPAVTMARVKQVTHGRHERAKSNLKTSQSRHCVFREWRQATRNKNARLTGLAVKLKAIPDLS